MKNSFSKVALGFWLKPQWIPMKYLIELFVTFRFWTRLSSDSSLSRSQHAFWKVNRNPRVLIEIKVANQIWLFLELIILNKLCRLFIFKICKTCNAVEHLYCQTFLLFLMKSFNFFYYRRLFISVTADSISL